jgi:hypothetical protein
MTVGDRLVTGDGLWVLSLRDQQFSACPHPRSGALTADNAPGREIETCLSSAVRCVTEGRQGVRGGALGHFLGPAMGALAWTLPDRRIMITGKRGNRPGGHLMNVQSGPSAVATYDSTLGIAAAGS